MRSFLKFLALVIVLNVVRYVGGAPIEAHLGGIGMWRVMEQYPAIFKNHFSSFDWVTSYFYNFLMWLTAMWVFMLLAPVLKGNYIVRSLKVFGLMLLFFCSLSAIYMNHYSHPRAFYLWSCVDGLIVFPLVAVANGLLFPLFFSERVRGAEISSPAASGPATT